MTRTGLDVALERGLDLPGRGRFALLCNNATLDAHFRGTPEALESLNGIALDRILAPQHGFAGEKQDNMIESGHGTHPGTGRPIFSLYGDTRRPTDEMLRDLDAIVIDLPDVGTRVYTFLVTATYVLEAAAKAGVGVWILDRPNPIGGVRIDGPMLHEEFRSFVGHVRVPLQHGLTVAEYLRLARAELALDVELHTLEVEGWERGRFLDETDIPWALPSPNMPTVDTASVFPGGVILEGTELSEGRGTTRPFELWGAPWLDPGSILSDLPASAVNGCLFREVAFEPTFHKFGGETVRGFQVHVTDRNRFRPVLVYLAALGAIRARHREFNWRQPPYEYETVRMPVDLILGTDSVRLAIDDGIPLDELSSIWERDVSEFEETRRPFLLYE